VRARSTRTTAAAAAPHERADGEDAGFGAVGHRELTAACYHSLVRKAAGRLPEVARLPGLLSVRKSLAHPRLLAL
jgi:hypothetical protein